MGFLRSKSMETVKHGATIPQQHRNQQVLFKYTDTDIDIDSHNN